MTCDLCQKLSERCLPIPAKGAQGQQITLWLCPPCYATADANDVYELGRVTTPMFDADEAAYQRERFA